MTKILGKIFGSKEVINGVMEGSDKLFFTKEEKADKWIETMKAYEPFKIAQRLIALMFSGVFLFVFLMGVILIVLSAWIPTIGTMGKDIITLNIETLGISIALIVGFYFAGGTISSFKSRAQDRKELKK